MNFSIDFFAYQKLISCVNLILLSVVNNDEIIFKTEQDFQLEYPVLSMDVVKRSSIYLETSNPNIYLVDIDKLSIGDFLEKFNFGYSNSRAQFIFIGRYLKESEVKLLIEKYVVNFLFIKYPTGEIHTTFPYKSRHLWNFSTDLEQLGHCREEKTLRGELFPDKLPRSWDGFTLSLLYRHDVPYTINPRGHKKGIEFDLLDIILAKMGIRGRYTSVGDLRSNTILFLKYFGKFDILFGNEKLVRKTPYECTIPYSCYSLYWYAPKSNILPKWKLIFNTFSIDLCWLWGSLLLLFCAFWYLIYITLKKQWHLSYFFEKVWIVITFVLEQPANCLSDFITIIILLFLILQSSLILNVLYKAKYTSLLSTVNYYGEIDSLEKIMENKLKMGLTYHMYRVYKANPSVAKYLETNYVECDVGNECLFRSALKRDIAVLKPERKVNFFQHLLTDENGSPYLYKVMPPVLTNYNTFFFPNGHPLFPLINKFMSYLLDHGFVDKVISKYEDLSFKYITVNLQVKLNFDHVKAAFIVLLVGNSIALLIFIIENLMLGKN